MSEMTIQIDKRPRCKSEGEYLCGLVPCDLHEGHSGRHLWQKPMSFEEYTWTDARKKIKRAC